MPSKEFEAISERILKNYLDFRPNVARQWLGNHEYDGKMADYSQGALTQVVKQARQELESLRRIDETTLDEQERFDRAVLEHNLESTIFNLEERRDWEDSPIFYNIPLQLTSYLTRNYAPLPERLEGLTLQERAVPDFLAAARANLKPPFSHSLLEAGLQVLQGQVRYRQIDLVEALQQPEVSPALRAECQQTKETALTALQQFIGYLKEQLPHSHDDFALGQEMYEKLLRYDELITMPLEKVLEAGERDLERNYAEFVEIARQIDPHASPEEVRERQKRQYPAAKDLISYTQDLLENIRRFLLEKDLITIPGEDRPIVAPTPPPLRIGFAMMRPAGSFENSAESYYYISLPEESWSEERQAGWLTFFNYANLDNISIHEVYPGHFVHFRHIHQATSPVAKTLVLDSACHFEGWAHYTEQMMLDEGYGNGDPNLRLAQLDLYLQRDCRYLASIKMHTQGMTVAEATQMFMKYAHMEEGPAQAEVLRGTWQPGYFSYTLGKLMFFKLREDLKKRDAQNFSLKAFHDACVGYGSPPVPLLRRRLLGEADDGVLL